MKGENTLRGRHPYFFAIKALQRNLLQNVTKMKGENTLKGRHPYFFAILLFTAKSVTKALKQCFTVRF